MLAMATSLVGMPQSLASIWSALTRCPPSSPPGEGDEQLGCFMLGWGEEVVMRRGHALFLLAWSRLSGRIRACYATVGDLRARQG
jgi:hypothetical protein